MRHNKFIQAIYVFIGSFVMAACSQSEELSPTATDGTLKIRVIDSTFQGSAASRANTNSEYVTTFSNGDKIGIFAVANQEAFIENTRAEYNNGTWVIETGDLPCSEDLSTVTFYAYYPYQESIAFDATKSDPFENVVKEWTVKSDLSGDNYTTSDLMTGAASADGATVTFVMQHRMALVVAELPSITYNFTNTDVTLSPYSVALQDVKFTIGEQEYTPYYDKETVTYRLLVNSSEEIATIAGSFTSPKDNKAKNYSIDATKLTAGEYIYCEVDGGPQTVDYELKVGDLVYSNGALASVDNPAAVSKDCAGVVYFVGNPMPSMRYSKDEAKPDYTFSENQDALLRNHPACTHGLVLGLKEHADVKFVGSGGRGYIHEWYHASFADAASYICASAFVWNPDKSQYEVNNTFRDLSLGYNHTEVMKIYSENEGRILSILTLLDAYSLPAPELSSGWFIPSVGDLKEVLVTNRDIITVQLGKVGADALAEKYYWSSTERDGTSIYGVQYLVDSKKTNISGINENKSTEVVNARFAFAF